MKKIAYLITSSGVDGRERTTIEHAFWEEDARDTAFDADKNKGYLAKSEQIVDVPAATKEALNKLDGLEQLLLGLGPKVPPKVVHRKKDK